LPSRSSPSLASPRLRALAERRTAGRPPEAQEHCELCGAPIAGDHRHLLDLDAGQPLCACRPCSVLFDRRAAGGGHYRLIPERRINLTEFALDDVAWEELRIPVEMAFFHFDSRAGRVMAFYPSPMGATESRLELAAWEELEQTNPVLTTLEPDVEALLVNRARGARAAWVVPIDDCFRLVAVIRTRWRGFTGGREVWEEIDRFFAELGRRARSQDPSTVPQRS
jgi:hypothetical protein